MQDIFLAVLSLSVSIVPLLLLLLLLEKRLKKRISSKWMRMLWIVALVRLLFPVPLKISLLTPNMAVAFFTDPTLQVEQVQLFSGISLWSGLVIIWAVVTCLLLVYHVLDYGLFLRHLLRWSREPHDTAILEMAEEVRRTWKLRRPLRVFICAEMKTPAAVGFFSPTILLPSEHFDDADLELILHHEVAHLRRGDIVVKWCAVMVDCLYWFHPLVHWMHSRLEDTLEEACDVAVLQKLGQSLEIRKDYSYLILDIAAGKSGRFYPFTTCLQDTKEGLRTRIDNIFNDAPKRLGWLIVSLCSVCLLLSVGFVQLQYHDSNVVDLPLYDDAAQNMQTEAGDQSVVTIDLYQLERQLEETENEVLQ